jgi:hypothetical protein
MVTCRADGLMQSGCSIDDILGANPTGHGWWPPLVWVLVFVPLIVWLTVIAAGVYEWVRGMVLHGRRGEGR